MPGWLSSLRELIAEASPRRRFAFALLVLLPLAALAAAYLWFTPPVYRVLYTQLSDRSGGEVIAALEQLDIPYRLSAADGSIEVPADRLHAARYRLAARGLPRSDADAQDDAERAPRFGASSLQEQQRFQRALETDLARSIQALEAVELARVHLALPRVSPFLRDAPPATAAVLVRLRPGAHLQAEQVTTIRTLVAASVPRMKRSEVQVLDPRGMLLGETVPEPVQSQRRVLEQDLVRRARAVLTPWLGEDRVSVQVTVTLDDGESRQAAKSMQNRVAVDAAQPLEKSVRESEDRIERIQALVILGYDAGAEDVQRAGQLAQQALGLEPARGDSVNVYALPAATPPAIAENDAAPAEARRQAPSAAAVPRASPAPSPASAWAALPPWAVAAVVALLALLVMTSRRRRRPPPEVAAVEVDFDAELDAARNQVLANPRVTADVIRLWMRA